MGLLKENIVVKAIFITALLNLDNVMSNVIEPVPGRSVPDVLSHLSVPGQNVSAWDRKAS